MVSAVPTTTGVTDAAAALTILTFDTWYCDRFDGLVR